MSEPSTKSPLVPLAIAAVAAVALVLALTGTFSGGGGDDNAGDSDRERRPAASGTTGSGSGSDSGSGSGSGADTAPARLEKGDPLAKGELDAPVVLVAYSDFRCQFCGKWARDTAPVLERKYVDKGTLRIEWRDFPYLGEGSTLSAQAGRAAAAQGKFWEFHDALYADRQPPGDDAGRSYLEGVAAKIGLDAARFRRDLDSAKAKELVAADFAEGQRLGVSGTPTFVINGTPVVGAQPTEVFEQVIEDAAR